MKRVFWWTGVGTILTGTVRPDGKVQVDNRQPGNGDVLRPRHPHSLEKS